MKTLFFIYFWKKMNPDPNGAKLRPVWDDFAA